MRFRAWCRREGTLDAWPRKIRQVLRTLACDHSFTLMEGGIITKDLDVRPAKDYLLPDGPAFDLVCRRCQRCVALIQGDRIATT